MCMALCGALRRDEPPLVPLRGARALCVTLNFDVALNGALHSDEVLCVLLREVGTLRLALYCVQGFGATDVDLCRISSR